MTNPESNSELEALIKQQAEIAARIAEIQHDVFEQRKQADLTKPVILEVVSVENERVHVRSTYREDLVNLQRGLPSRYWNGTDNSFELRYWPDNLAKMLALPNVTVTYVNGVSEQLSGELSKPDYEVGNSPDDKWLLVKIGRADAGIVQRLPGARWDGKNAEFHVPIVEGWRLFDTLKTKDKVIWSDHALALVTADIERRTKLDAIALQKQAASEYYVDMREIKLRDFQAVGVEFADAAGGRIILADQMGLGKTPQAIAYAKLRNLRTLVICPASLKRNWSREILRFTGSSPHVHTGSIPDVWDMKAMVGSQKRQFHVINYDILAKKIETSEEAASPDDPSVMLKRNIRDRWLWVDLINMSAFDLVVLDEAHYIKNTDSLRSRASRLLQAPRILCMTGTPVMNRPGELWPLLTLLAPDKFPSFDAFLGQYTWNNRDARNVDELRELLKPLMIRRLKKDVVAELPPINRVFRWTELSPKAEKMYARVLEGIYETLAEWAPNAAGEEKQVMNMLVQLMRLKQICSVDRIDFVAETAVEINDSLEERTNGEHKDNSHKVIVFSQFVPIARAIAARLGNEAACITGELNQAQRNEVIEKFKTDPSIRFLVATDKVASEGLNLQEAHAVVFADLLWTPAGHEQCEGRAYGRLADLHGIDSYWCAASDTVDEQILKLLQRKMGVINQVVEGMDAERQTSVVKELLTMMKDEMGRRKK